MNHSVGSYSEDNRKTAKSEDDDLGLPEHPIYSNYTKHLWKAHRRQGAVQSPKRSRANTDTTTSAQEEPTTTGKVKLT
jgi:hypothetical protein